MIARLGFLALWEVVEVCAKCALYQVICSQDYTMSSYLSRSHLSQIQRCCLSYAWSAAQQVLAYPQPALTLADVRYPLGQFEPRPRRRVTRPTSIKANMCICMYLDLKFSLAIVEVKLCFRIIRSKRVGQLLVPILRVASRCRVGGVEVAICRLSRFFGSTRLRRNSQVM